MTGPNAPLSGLRVLDMTRVLSGPFCTLTLGDLGAEVIKIEDPRHGDEVRQMHVSEKLGLSSYFLAVNRNKKSVAIDITKPEGRDAVLEIAKRADVLVENYRTGVMQRRGLDYDTVATVNPGIVYCSISGYGRHGPDKDRPGYDPVVQAESGFMSLTGEPDGDPMRTGVSIIDVIAGLFAGEAILAALVERERSGKGQFIDVPLFDTSVNMLVHAAAAYLVDGRVLGREGNISPNAMPVGVFRAADGPFMLAMTSDRQFRTFSDRVLDRSELADDPAFADNPSRVENRERLVELLNGIFGARDRDHWIGRCREAGIPAGPIRDVAEALTSEEVAGRDLITTTPHPTAGDVPGVRSPMRLSRTPVVEAVVAPGLGEHTEAVLRDLAGYGDTEIERLRQVEAIRRD
ncbi:MAG: CoA transferase [Alphaproteobacteria bacterium]|jgi:crotonobetainyl-CoA:carnitine CoA-transferase CaiB-like acyl-CoA transferase|nr:CoA transferase [Alphaproteobacteria bacterium]